MAIETARLQLVPFAPEYVLALVEGVPQFEQRSGLRVAEGLRDFYASDAISPAWLSRLRATTTTDLWEHGFALVHRDIQSVIGGAGFKGPPDQQGMVEIAYGIVPSYQGRGYATEATAALVAFAFGSGRVRLIRAHTSPTANASTRVLAKCAFCHIGEVMDPEDGLVWRWERTQTSLSPVSRGC
jgi:[ribosomal protein S5]-alanine N-acetyltransferase